MLWYPQTARVQVEVNPDRGPRPGRTAIHPAPLWAIQSCSTSSLLLVLGSAGDVDCDRRVALRSASRSSRARVHSASPSRASNNPIPRFGRARLSRPAQHYLLPLPLHLPALLTSPHLSSPRTRRSACQTPHPLLRPLQPPPTAHRPTRPSDHLSATGRPSPRPASPGRPAKSTTYPTTSSDGSFPVSC